MKIIVRDNFGRENVSEKVIAESLGNHYGKRIVKLLNDSEEEFSPNYYDLVEDDYVLYQFRP